MTPQGEVDYPTPTATPDDYRPVDQRHSPTGLRPVVWSPNSQHIAYIYGRISLGLSGGMQVARTGNGTATKYTINLGLTSTQPTWSPDSSKIAFASVSVEDDRRHSTIHIMNPDGSEAAQIPGERIFPSHLAWHPDGSEILVANGSIYSLNPHTQELKLLIHGGYLPSGRIRLTGIAWSPDGTKMAIKTGTPWNSDNCTLHILTATRDGQDLTLIVTKGGTRTVPFVAVNKPVTVDVRDAIHAKSLECRN